MNYQRLVMIRVPTTNSYINVIICFYFTYQLIFSRINVYSYWICIIHILDLSLIKFIRHLIILISNHEYIKQWNNSNLII